ncbi:MAG: Fic family protein [Thiovulaceae bacterium]|nr:Fic family protein [Sulfurimonadaceae bacterium]
MSCRPPFTITSKILSLVSDIVEIITNIKHIETSLNTLKLRKKNRIKSITGTLQIEGIGSKDGMTHVAPPPLRVPELMQELFGWLKTTKEHPLIVSCIFHYEFEFIHPFSDGNGRIGRLWQSVILSHYQKIFGVIPIESVVRENQEAYYKALEDAGTAGEGTPFIEFMLEIILKTIKGVSKENVPLNVPKNAPLNRLDDILDLIQKNRDITSLQMAEILKISDKTVKRDISKLKEQNRLKRVGSLKSGHWEVVK